MSEVVEVMAVFDKHGSISPRAFKYAGRLLKIEKINLAHHIKQGRVKIFIFEVTSNGNSLTLVFNSETLQWQIRNYFYS